MECMTGIAVCTTVIILSVVFMTVDVFWTDTAFGTVLGVATWQVVNYVLNGVFTVLGLLIARNVLSLYRSLQRWLLVRQPGRPGEIPTAALLGPTYATPYILLRLKLQSPLILASIIAIFVPAFSTIAVFLVDFKQTSHSLVIGNVSSPIATLLAPWSTGLTEISIGFAPLSSLVLPSTLAQLPSNSSSFAPAGSCVGALAGCAGDSSLVNIIQFGGNSFSGSSTYGFGAFPQEYWSTNATGFYLAWEPWWLDRRLTSATSLKVARVGFAQSSNFTCKAIPANSSETPFGTPPSDDGWQTPHPVSQYVINSDGPCFGARNTTFIIGDDDYDGRFDIQACHTDTEIQFQMVAFFPRIIGNASNPNYVEAYSCSSAVVEGLSKSVQLSPNVITAAPPSDPTPVSADTLQRYVEYFNWYFDLPGWGNPQIGSNDGDSETTIVGTSRSQGDFTSVLRFNWGLDYQGGPGPYMWPGRQFLSAYGNALVSSLGTYFASSPTIFYPDPRTYDVIDKQVLQLGAPAAIGGPLLSVIVLLFLAHIALYWLCKQELLAVDTGDGVEMLTKVEVRDGSKVMVAELYDKGDDGLSPESLPVWMQSEASSVLSQRHRSRALTEGESEMKDRGSAKGLLDAAPTSYSEASSATL